MSDGRKEEGRKRGVESRREDGEKERKVRISETPKKPANILPLIKTQTTLI